MIVIFDCETCGAHVRQRRSPANTKSRPRFCSQQCHGKARRGTGHGLRFNHHVVCKHCGHETRVYRAPTAAAPQFCSLQCLGKFQRGENNPAFSGGRHQLTNGYIVVLAPDDPDADVRGYVLEHRLVARETLGRMLLPSEVVHHIDRDKTNNAPSNLRVFESQSAHLKFHLELEATS